MHVRLADEAYCVGPAATKDSYLRMDTILEVAKKSGAQGIHPGYGFLSENAKFVDMVEGAGIAFIGPSSGPMNDMGDKINSKRIAKAAGCFVIPGYEGEVDTEDDAARLASEVGYPVMIKASAGGGGKGMRVAYNDAEVREGFRLSKAEQLRRRPHVDRALHRGPPPHRDPGRGGHTWQRHRLPREVGASSRPRCPAASL
jgi:propionyl-CoA carboxylase alpha chain